MKWRQFPGKLASLHLILFYDRTTALKHIAKHTVFTARKHMKLLTMYAYFWLCFRFKRMLTKIVRKIMCVSF